MDLNDLTQDLLIKRLDMVFDKSNSDGINLNEQEVSDYVEFNKKYSEKIDNFINDVFDKGFLYLCKPDELSSYQENYFEKIPLRAEIKVTQINNFHFKCISITNYGFGDPNKIKDIYQLDLISNDHNIFNYELNSEELIRLIFQGSLILKCGDIIARDVSKALDALNKLHV